MERSLLEYIKDLCLIYYVDNFMSSAFDEILE